MRTGHHSDLLELELGRRRIPYVKYGGIRYLEAAHVKDFLALVRLVVNPADEVAWFRILQLLDQIGPRTARRILDTLDRQDPAAWPQQWSSLDLADSARSDGIALIDAATRAHGNQRAGPAGRAAASRAGAPDPAPLPGRRDRGCAIWRC